MTYPFASAEWTAALRQSINASPSYRAAAKAWEGDFWFVVEPEDAAAGSAATYLYLDLWHGACREAFVADGPDAKTPEFRIAGTSAGWARVIRRDIDPIRALLTGTLKLKGNLPKIMRNVRAAQELVLCAAAVPTTFTRD